MSVQQLIWNVTETTDASGHYQLGDGTEVFMELHYDASTETVKLQQGESRRTFKIEKKGFLKSKFTINNEYGVKIGIWTFDKNNNRNADIELYEEKFRCELINEISGEFELTFLANNNKACFELPVADAHYAGIHGNELSRLSPKQLSFIVAVCRYLQKATKEKVKAA